MAQLKWNFSPEPKWKKQFKIAMLFLIFAIYWTLILAFSMGTKFDFFLWISCTGWTALTMIYLYSSWENYTPPGKCANCYSASPAPVVIVSGIQGVEICKQCIATFAIEFAKSGEAIQNDSDPIVIKSTNPFHSPCSTIVTASCDFCDVKDQPQIRFGKSDRFAICKPCVTRFQKRIRMA